MYNKDVENIAKLYMEYTVDNEKMVDQDLIAAVSSILLGKSFPFTFEGDIEDADEVSFGDFITDITTEGEPIDENHINNIVKAMGNETLKISTGDTDSDEIALNSFIDSVQKQIIKSHSMSPLTKSYYGSSPQPSDHTQSPRQ